MISQSYEDQLQMYVGGISTSTTEQELYCYFGQFGSLFKIKLVEPKANGRKKYAFINCSSKYMRQSILSCQHFLNGEKLTINRAFAPIRTHHLGNCSRRKVFLQGISSKISDEDLTLYFSQFGELIKAYAIRDFSIGKSLYFGYLEYLTIEPPLEVIKLRKHLLKGSIVNAYPYSKRGNPNIKHIHNENYFDEPFNNGFAIYDSDSAKNKIESYELFEYQHHPFVDGNSDELYIYNNSRGLEQNRFEKIYSQQYSYNDASKSSRIHSSLDSEYNSIFQTDQVLYYGQNESFENELEEIEILTQFKIKNLKIRLPMLSPNISYSVCKVASSVVVLKSSNLD